MHFFVKQTVPEITLLLPCLLDRISDVLALMPWTQQALTACTGRSAVRVVW
jgi:hypothetical protein